MAGKMPMSERQGLQSSKQLRPVRQTPRRRFVDDVRKTSGKHACKREEVGNYRGGSGSKQSGKFNLQLCPPRGRQERGRSARYSCEKSEFQGEEQLEEALVEEEDANLPLKDRLIKFKYERHQGTTTTSCEQRRVRKIVSSYYREGFLHANCNFMVKDVGSYRAQLLDPDIPVEWDSIEEVCIKTCSMICCPICLYPPVASKITKCGHVYCWSCIIHYLYVDGSSCSKCPICFDVVKAEDLKSVTVRPLNKYVVGQTIHMLLMKRKKGSLNSMPITRWYDNEGELAQWTDWHSCGLPKLQVATADTVLQKVVQREKQELVHQLDAATAEESEEKTFIESALAQLKAQEDSLILRRKTDAAKTIPKQATLDSCSPSRWSSPTSPVAAGRDASDLSSSVSSTSSASLHHEEKDEHEGFYYFYQASDGQDTYIHPINVRCLIHEYGSFEESPTEIDADIIDVTTYTMNAELRKKFRYLSHLPLSCEFSICEVMLKHPVLSQSTIDVFAEQFKKRNKERERKKKQEKRFEKKMEAKQTLDCFGRAIVRYQEEPTHLDLNSHEDFPSYLCASSDQVVSSPNAEISEDIGEQLSPSVPSFSAALKTQKSPDWVPLRPPRSIAHQTGASLERSEPGFDEEPEDSEYTSVPSFHDSFCEAILASFRELAVSQADGVGKTGKKGKKGRQKGKKVLFTTGLNRISN